MGHITKEGVLILLHTSLQALLDKLIYPIPALNVDVDVDVDGSHQVP